MDLSDDQARALLRGHGVRITRPRIAVVRLLAASSEPLSHSEALTRLSATDCDPATIYRNLVRLTEVGIVRIVSHAEGQARYALITPGADEEHLHPHFHCEACGRLTCLPAALTLSPPDTRWRASLATATIQLRGACPDCLATSLTS